MNKKMLLTEEHIEKCWEILSKAEMDLNLRSTGHEYTNIIITIIQEQIKLQKEALKELVKITNKVE